MSVFNIGNFVEYIKDTTSDKAVWFGVSNKAWIFLSALLTAPIVLIFFSPQLQGYYYTFNSLLGMQTLFIMGVGQLIQQFVSHEWAKVSYSSDNGISGDKTAIQRLACIKDFTAKWYSRISLAMLFGLGIGGFVFLKYASTGGSLEMSVWLAPWLTICFLKSVQTFLSPGLIFLEGMNKVKSVYKFRLKQSILERTASWAVMIAGGKLWLFSGGTGVYLISQLNFLGRKFYNVLKEIFKLKAPENNLWKSEIFPLQWKYAVSAFSGYLNFTFVIPLIFWLLGPVEAGKLGITWSVLTKFWDMAVPFINTKMPLFTMYAARGEFDALTKAFLKSTLVSALILAVFVGSFLLLLALFIIYFPDIAERFLELLPSVFISMAIILHHLRFAMVSFMRTLKKEPFWKISILDIILIILVLPPLCLYFRLPGVSFGLLIVIFTNSLLTWLMFLRLKTELIGK